MPLLRKRKNEENQQDAKGLKKRKANPSSLDECTRLSYSHDHWHTLLETIPEDEEDLKLLLAKYIGSFLNGSGGILCFGASKHGRVYGDTVNRKEEDGLKLIIDDTIKKFHPHVSTSKYRVIFTPVKPKRREKQLALIEVKVMQGELGEMFEDEFHRVFLRKHGDPYGPLTPQEVMTLSLQLYRKKQLSQQRFEHIWSTKEKNKKSKSPVKNPSHPEPNNDLACLATRTFNGDGSKENPIEIPEPKKPKLLKSLLLKLTRKGQTSAAPESVGKENSSTVQLQIKSTETKSRSSKLGSENNSESKSNTKKQKAEVEKSTRPVSAAEKQAQNKPVAVPSTIGKWSRTDLTVTSKPTEADKSTRLVDKKPSNKPTIPDGSTIPMCKPDVEKSSDSKKTAESMKDKPNGEKCADSKLKNNLDKSTRSNGKTASDSKKTPERCTSENTSTPHQSNKPSNSSSENSESGGSATEKSLDTTNHPAGERVTKRNFTNRPQSTTKRNEQDWDSKSRLFEPQQFTQQEPVPIEKSGYNEPCNAYCNPTVAQPTSSVPYSASNYYPTAYSTLGYQSCNPMPNNMVRSSLCPPVYQTSTVSQICHYANQPHYVQWPQNYSLQNHSWQSHPRPTLPGYLPLRFNMH